MIFNGIEIMFFLLGVCATLGIWGMVFFNKNRVIKWHTWLVACFTIFMFLFTVAWSWSSVLEGEPQAASLGLVFFGIPTVILAFVTRTLIIKSQVK